jgi:hypothetical protein
MIIQRKLFASQHGMVLLDNGKPKELGAITELMDLELQNGKLIKVFCVYFNLDYSVQSTDFFLFCSDNRQLITYSIGRKTNSFFRKLYTKAIGNTDSTVMDLFLEEFIGDYIAEGLMGNLPLN